jgi:hypothetical protein
MNIIGEIVMPVKRWWRLLHKAEEEAFDKSLLRRNFRFLHRATASCGT